ncbi:hypothetical protein [Dactylosporangium matsuzakiense]|uniref:Uncharacterized protein n=1 Tax=Dactylosporangium matsuzakiense TaxID=53360 RepID=A0A9W6KJD8_9ACTN|nr:hypothetical protein [Dactylosporangium matsuzakiense]UWZ47577.1 hypothetical protein Dmats_14900 [Dactylosporangium matsuzakiense]GLL01594.1 hypothetical protein GCM10017581_033360 [Dactylosporangium matsuzakiense]
MTDDAPIPEAPTTDGGRPHAGLSPGLRRRLGWASLAVGVAAIVAFIPPLVLPAPPPAPDQPLAAPSTAPPMPSAPRIPPASGPAGSGPPPAAGGPSAPDPTAADSTAAGQNAAGQTSGGGTPTGRTTAGPATAGPAPTTAGPGFRPMSLHAADAANLRNGARVIECATCDGGSRVGYIGGPNTLAIRVPEMPAAGERTLVIVYETQDLRTLKVAVADGPVHTLTLAGAGDYLIPARTSISVYVPAGTTWIRFFNDSGDAPDINRIELR